MRNRWGARMALACAVAVLAGCAVVPVADPAAEIGRSPWAFQSRGGPGVAQQASGWRHLAFPGKQPTRFDYARKDGRDAVAVLAASSASMLRSKVRIEPDELRGVRFSWKVPQLIAGADVAVREADDSPVRIVLFFEGDRSRLSARDAMLSELVRTMTGE